MEHARMAEAYEMDPRGAAIEFRKHLGWYVKGIPGSADLRRKLHQVVSLGEVEELLEEYLAGRVRGVVVEDESSSSIRVAVGV
jgi:tRNA-dihydrouridine synthase